LGLACGIELHRRGAGGGLLLFTAIAGYGWDTTRAAILLGLILIASGLTCVWFEIGRPWRALNVYRHFATSWMTREAVVALGLFATGGLALLTARPLLVALAGILDWLSCIARRACWRPTRNSGMAPSTQRVPDDGDRSCRRCRLSCLRGFDFVGSNRVLGSAQPDRVDCHPAIDLEDLSWRTDCRRRTRRRPECAAAHRLEVRRVRPRLPVLGVVAVLAGMPGRQD